MLQKKCLSDNEAAVLRLYVKLMRATETVISRGHRRLPESGLTLSQFGVLEALYHLGPLCQKEIGRKTLKSNGNITTVIDNLEKRRLVIRERDRQDRRFSHVKLTGHGRELIARTFPVIANDLLEAFSALDEKERDLLGEICRKLGHKEISPQENTNQGHQSPRSIQGGPS